MIIFLEPNFDAILKIDNKDYFCEKNVSLKISELNEDFFVFCFPKNENVIPFSFMVKPYQSEVCSHPNVKTYQFKNGDIYMQIVKTLTDANEKSVKINNNLYILEKNNFLSVLKNSGEVIFSTRYEKYEITKDGLLYVFKNYSPLIGSELVEIYSLNDNSATLKSSECVCKNTPNNNIPSKELLPFVFFEACKSHYFSFAKTLLADDFAQKSSPQSLQKFFEPFYEMRKNDFTEKGFILFPENSQKNVVFVDFILNSANKIDNIIEIM